MAKQADSRLPNHIKIQEWILSFDYGWKVESNFVYKGYDLDHHGNWTKICFQDQIKIEHDALRSYPLWWDNHSKVLTNFLGSGEPIWVDKKVTLNNDSIILDDNDVIGSLDMSVLSLDTVVDKIIDNLQKKLNSLRSHCDLPVKLFVSGGIDTVLLYALIKNQNFDCEIITCEHLDYNWFLDNNLVDLQNRHWGYRQIHHWNNPCMLLTGSCGDEFFMRGPNTLALWCAWHDIDIENLFGKDEYYHKGYFLLPKNKNIFDDCYSQRKHIQTQYSTELELKKQILNINSNDHQYWHLGHTLTWTPYKDLEITKIILQLSKEDIIDQIKHASLNRKIIQKLWPDFLNLLSLTKNKNPRENLHRLYI